MEYFVRQGDAYSIPFPIVLGRYVLSPAEIEDVEITFGDISKTYKDGDIVWNPDRYLYEFPLEEAETFEFVPCQRVQSQVRYKLKKFDTKDKRPQLITSFNGPTLIIISSLSEEQFKEGENELW